MSGPEQLEMLLASETKAQRLWRIAAEWSKRAKNNPGHGYGRVALRFIKAAQREQGQGAVR